MSGVVTYDETEIINFLYKSLNLGEWWKELLVFNDDNEVDIYKSTETIAWSESRTATVIAEKFGKCLSYVEFSGQWYAWNGRIHIPCEGISTARKLVGFYVTAIEYALDHIESVIDKKVEQVKKDGGENSLEKAKKYKDLYNIGYKPQRQFRNRLHSNAGVTSLTLFLQSEVAVSSKYYENDHNWFVMRNCVMDLEKFRAGEDDGVLVEHDPSRPVTRYFDADYNSMENYGHWDRFLESSLPKPNVRDYLQMVCGAAFMAETKTKVIINAIGKKDTGKSIFIGTFYDLCQAGAGYMKAPDALSIMKIQGQNFGQDKFRGQRMIIISEPDETQVPDTAFLKRFSGDDVVESSDKYAKSTAWRPQGILFIASNNHLKINTRDKATVDRIKIVEFPNQFLDPGPGVPEELQKIPDLKEKISMDSGRVLTWILEGMVMFRENGFTFNEPAEIAVSQENLVVDSSSAIEWGQELTAEGTLVYDLDTPIYKCLNIKQAFSSYMVWCDEANTKALSRKFFTKDIVATYGELELSDGFRIPGLAPTQKFAKYDPQVSGYPM